MAEIRKRLAVLDVERVELLTQLGTMGFRTRGLVGEYGELLAAAVYAVLYLRLRSPAKMLCR